MVIIATGFIFIRAIMVIIEHFLTTQEVLDFRVALKTAPWLDGKASAEGMAAEVKNNAQADVNDAAVKSLTNQLLARIGTNPTLVSAALPSKVFPPCFNRYREQETYGYHVDAAIMRVPHSQEVLRSDLSMTLFLSAPDEYDGGELTIATDFGANTVKLNAGDAVVYPSSSMHKVTPVTRGERLAAICWMQSLVADAQKRQTLFQLDQTIQQLSGNTAIAREHLDQLHNVYHNLVRQEAEV